MPRTQRRSIADNTDELMQLINNSEIVRALPPLQITTTPEYQNNHWFLPGSVAETLQRADPAPLSSISPRRMPLSSGRSRSRELYRRPSPDRSYYNTSNPTLGVELEFEGGDHYDISQSVPQSCGVAHDGSLQNGLEIQTPPANDSEFENIIHQTCDAIRSGNGVANARCGLHVHVGVNRSDMAFMKRFLLLGIAFEDLFFASQPSSRYMRSFCQPFERLWPSPYSSVLNTEPQNIPLLYYQTNPDNLRTHTGDHYDSMRYFGFNIHPALSGQIPTVEFRFHEGTIDPEEIISYAQFCSGFVRLAQGFSMEVSDQAVTTPGIMNRLKMLENYPSLFTPRSLEYMKTRIKKYGRSYVQSKGKWSASEVKK